MPVGAKYTVKIDLVADAKIGAAFEALDAALGKVSGHLHTAAVATGALAKASAGAGAAGKRAAEDTASAWEVSGRTTRNVFKRVGLTFREIMRRAREANRKTVKAGINDWFRYRYRVRAAMRGITHKTGFMVGAAAGGVYGFARHFLGAGVQAQTQEGGIAVQLMAASASLGHRFDKFSDAITEAARLRQTARQMAIASPVGADAIQQSFSRIVFLASRVGMSLDSQMKLARNLATLDLVGGQQAGVAAGDLRQLLRGSFVAKQIQNPMLRAVGRAIADAAKSGDKRKALEIAVKATELDKGALEYFQNSAQGQLATLEDKWRQFREDLSKPILVELGRQFTRFMEWFNAHKDQIAAKAREIGDAIADWVRGVDWRGVADSFASLWRSADSVAQALGGWVSAAKTFAIVWLSIDFVSGLAAMVGLLKQSIFLFGVGLPRAAAAGTASMAGLNAVAMAVPSALATVGGALAGISGAAIGLMAGVALLIAGEVALIWHYREQMREAFGDMFEWLGEKLFGIRVPDHKNYISGESDDAEKRKLWATQYAKNHHISAEAAKKVLGIEIYTPEEFRARMVEQQKAHPIDVGTGNTLKAEVEQ